jgi:hypothetical protein
MALDPMLTANAGVCAAHSQGFIIMAVKGRPGKLTLSGGILGVTDYGGPDQEAEVGTISAMQVAAP